MKKKFTVLILVCLLPVFLFAETDREKYFHDFLNQFAHDPARTSQKIPAKYNSQGKRILQPKRFLPKYHDNDFAFVKDKARLRQQIMQHSQFFEQVNGNNNIRSFFDWSTPLLKKVGQINDSKYNSVKLEQQPWSGDYWGLYRGGIGARYADDSFTFGFTFKENYELYQKYWPIDYSNTEAINNLSPAEKYDLLVGDKNFSLTKAAWAEGKAYFDQDGKVPTWFGICDGWSGSSLSLPRPLKPIKIQTTVTNANNEPQTIDIVFYPDDLKALASSLWAKGHYEQSFVGGRCDTENPKRDSNGRLLDPDCFDINPASLHMLLINRIHEQSKGFVMDANYDAEVWNHPVTGYDLVYFNPITQRRSKNINDVMIDKNKFTNDKFKKYRSPDMTSIVGVDVEISYMLESSPAHRDQDSVENDNKTSVQYIYDLELDKDGNIIGGEWYQNSHPDFIWAPKGNARAKASNEPLTQGDWDGVSPIPAEWLKYIKNSSDNLQPFAKIVEKLFEISQQK